MAAGSTQGQIESSEKVPHGMDRNAAMSDPAFKSQFDAAKEHLKTLRAAFIELDNDLELHIFEAYAAMELDTSRWNTLRTH